MPAHFKSNLARASLLALVLAAPLCIAPAAHATTPAPAKATAAPAPADPAQAALQALDPTLAQAIDTALAGAQRSAEDRARDEARKPKESLAFWGFRPDMTVVEVAPGGGYWTEILAPLMSDKGTLVLASVNTNAPVGRGLADLTAKLASDPKSYGRARLAVYQPAQALPIGTPGSADLVIVSRHMHGLINNKLADNAMKMYFDALKSGGSLVIEQHRWPANKEGFGTVGVNPAFRISGYVPEALVIEAAEKAGFRLASRSELYANPKDDHDHPFGVWTLKPMAFQSANGQADANFDRAPFDAVGESDRMLLKFVKP
jgi:predicted methyltransferase